MITLTISEARNQIPALCDAPTSTVLTKNGHPVGVVMPIREYSALKAMLRLAEDPATLQQVVAAHQKVLAGQLESFVKLEAMDDAEEVQPHSL